MASTISGGGFNFSAKSIGGTWHWTVFTSSLLGPGQTYQVQDITTPYGPITVVAVPLPADVVQAMAQSIIDVQGQVKSKLSCISSKTSFSMGVTEKDPMCSVGTVQIRNDGGFGSFLSATATPDVPWLTVSIPEVQGLGRGDVAQFSINLVPDSMHAVQSPFVGHVRIQDSADSTSFVMVSVSVIVLPSPAIGVNVSTILFSWSTSAPSPYTQQVTVTNSGPGTSVLNFKAEKLMNVPWLTVTPESSGPIQAGYSDTVFLRASGPSVPQSPGEYVETVRIQSTNASNSPVDIRVVLSVTS